MACFWPAIGCNLHARAVLIEVVWTEDSSLRSLPRSSIRKLKVYQPPRKRYLAQVCSGLTESFMFGWLPHKLYDIHAWFLLMVGTAVTAPVVYVTFKGLRWKLVYRAS